MIFYRKSSKCQDFLIFLGILGKKFDNDRNCGYNSWHFREKIIFFTEYTLKISYI